MKVKKNKLNLLNQSTKTLCPFLKTPDVRLNCGPGSITTGDPAPAQQLPLNPASSGELSAARGTDPF